MISDIHSISVERLDTLFRNGDTLVLLDVRRHEERARCSIPAPSTCYDIHIPMHKISALFDELFARGGRCPVIVYCHHGVRSRVVATWLVGLGLSPVYNLEGGIDAWSVCVDPEVRRY